MLWSFSWLLATSLYLLSCWEKQGFQPVLTIIGFEPMTYLLLFKERRSAKKEKALSLFEIVFHPSCFWRARIWTNDLAVLKSDWNCKTLKSESVMYFVVVTLWLLVGEFSFIKKWMWLLLNWQKLHVIHLVDHVWLEDTSYTLSFTLLNTFKNSVQQLMWHDHKVEATKGYQRFDWFTDTSQ